MILFINTLYNQLLHNSPVLEVGLYTGIMTIALKIIMHSDVHKFLDTHIDTGDSICPAVIAPQ